MIFVVKKWKCKVQEKVNKEHKLLLIYFIKNHSGDSKNILL